MWLPTIFSLVEWKMKSFFKRVLKISSIVVNLGLFEMVKRISHESWVAQMKDWRRQYTLFTLLLTSHQAAKEQKRQALGAPTSPR